MFDRAQKKILFWVASRGHHADIGGIAPGSMSPIATSIEEEGIYIDNFKLVDRGKFREAALYDLLTKAQVSGAQPAAERQRPEGADRRQREGRAGAAQDGRRCSACTVVHAYMKHVQDNADESVRRVIDRLHDSEFSYEADQGNVIKVKITVDKEKREATVDFTGTSPQQGTNFNAPEPVTRAAVLYVFRVMVDDDIPMNAGCLRPINIVDPRPLDAAAALSRGGRRRQCRGLADRDRHAVRRARRHGGRAGHHEQRQLRQRHAISITRRSARARRPAPAFPGTDAVHTHMTNTRLTDPEILEFRYPVVLEDFHIRKGSGGKGKWNAGDGIRRTMRFLEKMEYTVLSGHRRIRPFGLAGGEDGQIGENYVRRKDGTHGAAEGRRRHLWSTPAKRSSSRRRPRAGTASRASG